MSPMVPPCPEHPSPWAPLGQLGGTGTDLQCWGDHRDRPQGWAEGGGMGCTRVREGVWENGVAGGCWEVGCS